MRRVIPTIRVAPANVKFIGKMVGRQYQRRRLPPLRLVQVVRPLRLVPAGRIRFRPLATCPCYYSPGCLGCWRFGAMPFL